MRLAILAFAALTAAPLGALAQTPQRVKGVIEKADSGALVLKAAGGQDVSVKLASNVAVSQVVPMKGSDIKAGSFIGAGARPQADGTLKAIQVYVFPEAMRGTGEGHRDWILPESTMTNATVADTVTSVDGAGMTLNYKGGEKKLVIPADAVVYTTKPVGASDLKPGVDALVYTTKSDDGSTTSARVVIAKDGAQLPM